MGDAARTRHTATPRSFAYLGATISPLAARERVYERLAAVGAVLAWALSRGLLFVGLGDPNDTRIYFNATANWLSGATPYVDYIFEYPPGVLALSAPAASLVADADSFRWTFAASMLVLDALVIALLVRFGARGRRKLRRTVVGALVYVVLTGLLSDLVVLRMDMAVGLGLLGFALAHERGRPALASVAIAALVWLKVVGLLLIPLHLLMTMQQRPGDERRRRLVITSSVLIASLVALWLPFVARSGTAALTFFTYHLERGLQIESVSASAVLLLGQVVDLELTTPFEFGASHVRGPLPDLLATGSTWLMALLVGAATVIARRREALSPTAATFAVALATLVGSKVLSPQFLVWLAPVAGLWVASGQARARHPIAWLLLATLLTTTMMRTAYGALVDQWLTGALVLAMRNGVLVVALIATLSPWRPRAALSPHAHRAALAVIGALALVVASVYPVASPDTWLHIAAGDHIRATGAVGVVPDPFGALTEGAPWVLHSWLSELVMSGAHAWAGDAGLIALRVVMLLIIVALVALQIPAWRRRLPAFLLMLLLAAVIIRTRSHVRPYLLAFGCIAGWRLVVARWEARGRDLDLAWLLPLQVLWANLHASAVLGPLLLATVAVARWGSPHDDGHRRSAPRLAGAAALCGLATLVTPLGPRLWGYALELFVLSPWARDVVDEWQRSPTALERSPLVWVSFALLTVAAWGVWAQRHAAGHRARLAWVVVVGGLALSAVRHTPLVALLLLPIIAEGMPAIRRTLSPLGRRFPPAVQVTAAVSVLVMALHIDAMLAAARPRYVPPAAIETLTKMGLAGRIWAPYEDGSIVVYAGAPALKPTMDGRVVLQGRERLDAWHATLTDPSALIAYLDTHAVDLALLRPDKDQVALGRRLVDEGWVGYPLGDHRLLYVRPATRARDVLRQFDTSEGPGVINLDGEARRPRFVGP